MPRLKSTGTNGVLRIQSTSAGWLSMHGPAWNLLDCGPLDSAGPKRGGGGVIISGVEGVWPLPTRPTLALHSLPFIVTGDVDPAGTVIALGSRESTFDTTMKYLNAQLIATPASSDGTRLAELTLRNGDVRHAAIHCLGFTWVGNLTTGHSRAFTFDIDIPSGRFV